MIYPSLSSWKLNGQNNQTLMYSPRWYSTYTSGRGFTTGETYRQVCFFLEVCLCIKTIAIFFKRGTLQVAVGVLTTLLLDFPQNSPIVGHHCLGLASKHFSNIFQTVLQFWTQSFLSLGMRIQVNHCFLKSWGLLGLLNHMILMLARFYEKTLIY